MLIRVKDIKTGDVLACGGLVREVLPPRKPRMGVFQSTMWTVVYSCGSGAGVHLAPGDVELEVLRRADVG